MPVSSQIRRSSSLSRSRVISSSAPNGSSISSRRGPPSRARAIETRWRMPPESSCGKLVLPALEADQRSSSRGVGAPAGRPRCAADLERQLDILERGAPRQQRRVLEHEAERARSSRASRGVRAEHGDRPARRRRSDRRRRRSSVDLPQPDGPSRLRKPPRSTEKETFSSAVTVRRSVMKRTETLRQSHPASARGRCRRLDRREARARLGHSAMAQPIFGRASAVALRMSSVITSSSLGVRLENCPSSA